MVNDTLYNIYNLNLENFENLFSLKQILGNISFIFGKSELNSETPIVKDKALLAQFLYLYENKCVHTIVNRFELLGQREFIGRSLERFLSHEPMHILLMAERDMEYVKQNHPLLYEYGMYDKTIEHTEEEKLRHFDVDITLFLESMKNVMDKMDARAEKGSAFLNVDIFDPLFIKYLFTYANEGLSIRRLENLNFKCYTEILEHLKYLDSLDKDFTTLLVFDFMHSNILDFAERFADLKKRILEFCANDKKYFEDLGIYFSDLEYVHFYFFKYKNSDPNCAFNSFFPKYTPLTLDYELPSLINNINISLFQNDIIFFLPYLFLIFLILSLLIFILTLNNYKNQKDEHYNLFCYSVNIILFGFLILIFLFFNLFKLNGSCSLFLNLLILNTFSISISIFISFLFIIFLFYLKSYLKIDNILTFEFVILLLLSLLGMLLLLISNDFIAFYLALELQSLAFYILASFYRNSTSSTEAGLKYFILGAIASILLLFGISLIYGFTGITNFTDLILFNQFFNFDISDYAYLKNGLFFGLIFVFFALCFKMGLVPFHLWIPDIYEGVSTIVLTFFAIFPKIIFLSISAKLFTSVFLSFHSEFHVLFLIVSILSILFGSIGGLYQIKIKRLFAYSAIANVGFLGLGLSLFSISGFFSLFFYLFFYIILLVNFFGILLSLYRYSDNFELKKLIDLKNLFLVNPVLAVIFALTLFSFAGIPPLVGFFIKMFVLSSLINSNLYLISILVVFLSSISAFYYIRLIKIMFFDVSTTTDWLFLKPISKSITYIISLTFLINILFIVFPEIFLSFVNEIIFQYFI